MGYHTDIGYLDIKTPMGVEQMLYVQAFAKSPRYKRDPALLMKVFGGQFGKDKEYGIDAEFFVPIDDELLKPDPVAHAKTCPSLYCEWTISEDGKHLIPTTDRLSDFVNWLHYLIERIFIPWGIVIEGDVYWEGDEEGDKGRIVVKNNKVTVYEAVITYKKVKEHKNKR